MSDERSVVHAYRSGDVTAVEALCCLSTALTHVEDQIDALMVKRTELRDLISRIVASHDNVLHIPGVVTARITALRKRVTYTRAAVDAAVAELLPIFPEAALRIARCRTVSHAAGSLRLEKAKP
jgi:hypothetical protein